MFALLNATTFLIPSLGTDGQQVELAEGEDAAAALRSAGVTEYSWSGGQFDLLVTAGDSMPVVLDTAQGPFYGYIKRFAENTSLFSECWVEITTVLDTEASFTAQDDVPCRVQLHAHTYAAILAALP